MTNAKIGIALVGGYVLGRTKKAKLALGLGMYLAGKKLDLDPAALKRALAQSPALGELGGQAKEQLLTATKTAAKGALTQRVGSLADSLHSRAQDLDPARDEGDAEDTEDTEDAENTDAAAPSDEQDDGEESRESSAPRRAARKKTGDRPAAARRTASASGRKSAGAARKTASGTSRSRTAGKKESRRA